MKTLTKHLFPIAALVSLFGFVPAARLTAQSFTNLYSFSAVSGTFQTNSDGASPQASLAGAGNVLYGTAAYGGLGNGTVFKLNTDGTGIQTLHYFSLGAVNSSLGAYTNTDGILPVAGLVLSGNTLYGTAKEGGASGRGALFKVNTDGSGFATLYNFSLTSGPLATNSDGASPYAGLTLSADGSSLYGTAIGGGLGGEGTIFSLNTNGAGFTTLYSFTAAQRNPALPAGFNYTNVDGSQPAASLILSGNTLYGTTSEGGVGGGGTVFKLNTDGSGFTVLHPFASGANDASSIYTNSDGAAPSAPLLLAGDTLYGTASYGGGSGQGTVFQVSTAGTGFAVAHPFSALDSSGDNNDGAQPFAGLLLASNTLYGTTSLGGSSGQGTVFALDTNQTSVVVLPAFSAFAPPGENSDGAQPLAGLILANNTLYGTTSLGGTSGDGGVFSVSLGSPTPVVPQLAILLSGTNVLLTWPTNAVDFTLESTTDLAAGGWNPDTNTPAVLNGQNVVTNPVLGAQNFYRLKH